MTFKFINSILPSMGTKEYCVVVFLEFSKAFDAVDYDLLISKLEKYDVRKKSTKGTKGSTLLLRVC